MNAVRQSCRPKHQVLVLKCYPKYQKNNAEVKPNSSELSYLLYYASTRRSKLVKVGTFLDKRTASDVWKGRIGNVQVTLHILKSLIEKCSKDLSLFAEAVLHVIRTILRSNDITMVEESVPAWETFCAHQDSTTLAADQEYIRQYEEVVQLYAAAASKGTPVQTKVVPTSVPLAIRFRKAGLEAIKAVVSSDSLSTETARQLAIIVPVTLQNLYSTNGGYLTLLQEREEEKEELEKELAYKRRQSISTVRTAETNEADPAAAEGTTEDADKLAEEEVGVVALQALRQIFTVVNRGQLRLATATVLKFMADHINVHEHFPTGRTLAAPDGSWPTTLFGVMCAWAPVQDRYIILVTAMETLVRSPIIEEDLEKQLVLTTVVGWLLASDINFIGLSVMDVLVGLIQHMLLLLQLGGHGSNLLPHHQQADVMDAGNEFDPASLQPVSAGISTGGVVMEVVKAPSSLRVQLLGQLQRCVGNLATHVYYTDQISDMILAILMRLRPPPNSELSVTTAAIQDPAGVVDAVASSVSLQERTHTDGFFSFNTARVIALRSVKEIIARTYTRKPDGSSGVVSRSSVPVSVWEGTQWLIRDPNWSVRMAYADALLSWLNRESTKDDLKVSEAQTKPTKPKSHGEHKDTTLARRAVSNASRREKSLQHASSTFLQLLHLAVYENAHQYSESEPDILLLHLLLTNLVYKLGVNAARNGLPMIMCLQEDIPLIQSPTAKTHIGSLVHGYLWALSVYFDFADSSVGREIHDEILRRNQHSIWLQDIRIPPLSLDRIGSSAALGPSEKVPHQIVQREALKPFENRQALIERIAEGYTTSLYSPPASPPSSPGRKMSVPILSLPKKPSQLPSYIKEELLADWTKDTCIASTTKGSPRSVSLSGSRTGSGPRNLLPINTANHDAGLLVSNHRTFLSRLNSRPPSAAQPSPRRASPPPTSVSSSSVRSTVRIGDLKRILDSTNGQAYLLVKSRSTTQNADDTASESVASADFSMSELSSTKPNMQLASEVEAASQTGSTTPRPVTGVSVRSADETVAPHDEVPPMPALSASLQLRQAGPMHTDNTGGVSGPSDVRSYAAAAPGGKLSTAGSVRTSRSLKRGSGRGGSGSRSRDGEVRGRPIGRKKDLGELLNEINVDDGDIGSLAGAGRPPY